MRTLRLEKYGKIFVDGEEVSGLGDKKEEFIRGILSLDIEVASDVNVGDVVHFFYEAKDLISEFFAEKYEVVQALANGSKLPKPYKEFRVYKSFKIENESLLEKDEYIYMLPEIEMIESASGDEGLMSVSALPLKIDENIKLKHGDVTIESKTKITMMDLMTCVFDELPALLKDGVVLSQ